MSKRNFPDFLDAYLSYAKDAFCPEQFHFWTGISTIAAALERRVWVDRGQFNLHPNLYILLVARPGVGKSSAGNVGQKFLRKLGTEVNRIRFIATQNSQASLIEQFAGFKSFFVGEKEHTHSSGYFYASEGSNALAEITGGGSIISCLTEFYDCPVTWEKALMQKDTKLYNVCCNMLACVTFSFLEQLVPQREVDGGFASRLLFVLQDEVFVRRPRWREAAPPKIEGELLEDLQQIYALTGEFSASPEFAKLYENWFPENDEHRQNLRSERMQSFLARKHTNVLKLCMICCVSEGNEMKLEMRHWERAMALIDAEEKKLPKVVKNSVDKVSSRGLNYNIMRILKERGASGILVREQLFRELVALGCDMSRLDVTLQLLHRSGLVMIENSPMGGQRFRLTGNPDDYL